MDVRETDMRDLCDSLMHHRMGTGGGSTENLIESFRNDLPRELRARFNRVIDIINQEDSEYMYEAFRRGVLYSLQTIE